MKKKERLCIDFSSNKLKLARLKDLANKKEITDIFVKDIRNLSNSEVAQVIRDILREMEVKSRQVLCILSSSLAMSKNIEIPSRDPKEIQEIINLQSGRYTPYSSEEIAIEYINIGIYRQNYSKVLLIIVPQKIIRRYLEILKEAELEPEKISIAPEGICRIYPLITRQKSVDAPISIIHMSDEYADFAVSLRNKMIFVRNIPIGVNNFLVDKDMYKEKFIEEIKKTLESYQSEDIEKTPSQIILTGAQGAPEVMEDIKRALDTTLYIPTVIVPYLEHFSVKKEVLDFISTIKQMSFLDIMSPLLIADELTINLIPKEVKLRQALEERGKEIIKMGILILAAFALICGILMSKLYFRSAYLEQLSRKYHSTIQEAQALEENFARIRVIRNYLSNRGYSLEVLIELFKILPPDIYLSNIKFSEEREFSIKGTSESMSTVFTLVGDMEKTAYFQNVKTKYTTKRKENDRDLTDFQISCTLAGLN
jgi:Tfp pilus assembly PilM family ATPase/Tfp pilus assembly protein PilN